MIITPSIVGTVSRPLRSLNRMTMRVERESVGRTSVMADEHASAMRMMPREGQNGRGAQIGGVGYLQRWRLSTSSPWRWRNRSSWRR